MQENENQDQWKEDAGAARRADARHHPRDERIIRSELAAEAISTQTKPMNTEIEKQIALLIEAAKSTGADAVDFIKKQSPDYFSQLIKWHAWGGALTIISGIGWLLASIIAGAVVLPLIYRSMQAGKEPEPYIILFVLVAFILAAVACVSVLAATEGVTQIIKARVAPKVIIADAINNALKGEGDE